MQDIHIAGYDYRQVAQAPVSLAELRVLEATVGLTEQDRAARTKAALLTLAPWSGTYARSDPR